MVSVSNVPHNVTCTLQLKLKDIQLTSKPRSLHQSKSVVVVAHVQPLAGARGSARIAGCSTVRHRCFCETLSLCLDACGEEATAVLVCVTLIVPVQQRRINAIY